MTTTITRPARPWRTAGVAGMASYLDAGVLITTGIGLVLYAPTIGVSPNAIGSINGVLTLMFAIGALFGGSLGDRLGRRRVFTVTLAVYIVGIALLAFAVAPTMLYAGVVLAGLAIGADLPVSLSLINEEAPEGKKAGMIAFSALLWFLGIAVPSILSSIIAPLGALAGRILYGQLLLVAIVVLILRFTLRESAEWIAAKSAKAEESGQIRFSHLGQLFKVPIVATMVALGLYYALWNIGASTFGSFSTFLFTALAHTSVQFASLISVIGLPIGFVAGLVFVRVANGRARWPLFVIGTIAGVVAFLTPLLFGATPISLVVFSLLFGLSASFSGEVIYKIWSQELVPTLLRGTVQGVTMAFTRVIAAGFAFATPALALSDSRLLFGILVGGAVLSGIIGLFWVRRLPQARQLETPPVLVGASRVDPSTADRVAAPRPSSAGL